MERVPSAGGAGVRYLIFPDKDIYTRIDVSFTREGSGVYFFHWRGFLTPIAEALELLIFNALQNHKVVQIACVETNILKFVIFQLI